MRIRPDNFTRFFYFVALLAALSLAIVGLLKGVTKYFGIELPFWIETPSVVGLVVALYSLFDKHLWAWPLFRWFRVIDFPDLRGRWTGRIKSSFKHEELAVIEIVQSSSRVVVSLYTERSQSVSQIADFTIAPNGQTQLHYIYRNTPALHSHESMQIHVGTVALTVFDDVRVLDGEYYTGRGRQTYGTMRFDFSARRLLHRFRP
jgi:hypothetical protein